TLSQSQYYFTERDSTTNYIKEEDTWENFDIAVGGLLNCSWKIKNSRMIGFSSGAALSLFDQKLRYLLGLSYYSGRENRFGCSIGITAARLERISDYAFSDDNGSFVLSKVETVPTAKDFQIGGYVGIVYSLGKRK